MYRLHPLQRSLARIFRSSKDSFQTCGAGVVVSKSHVLTCTHVAMTALGLSEMKITEETISLDFPFSNLKRKVTARISMWNSETDLAVLKIIENLPRDITPATFSIADNLWEHNIQMFGFPAGYSDGTWAQGQLRGSNVSGWVEIVDSQLTGYYVQPGFSGGPVWDNNLKYFVGIIVASESKASLRTSYLIPTNKILEKWKKLITDRIPLDDYHPSPIICPRCASQRSGDLDLPCPVCGSRKVLLGYRGEQEIQTIVRARSVVLLIVFLLAIIAGIILIVCLFPK
ncbi:MAG TPA: serine protease [Anaerolineales bacterium]|nr:serine protease [Anaerolineales bacterium]